MWRAFGNEAQAADPGFIPRYLAVDSALYKALFGAALDACRSASTCRSRRVDAIGESFGTALPYVLLVVLLGGLYFVQQRMVAARAAISPTMSQAQQKLMQYLPVFFAVFQVFFLAALVVYYIFQTVLRIAQQIYITKAFYGHDEALGRQAQRAGEAARDEAAEVRRVDGHVRPAQTRAVRLEGRDLEERQGSTGKTGKPEEGRQVRQGQARRPARREQAPSRPNGSRGEQARDAAEESADAVDGGEGPTDAGRARARRRSRTADRNRAASKPS